MTVSKTEITFFQTCTSVTFFLGVPTNALILIYLVWGSKDHCRITRNLYSFIVTTDLLFAITVSPFSIQQISGIQLYHPSNQIFCEVFEFSFETLSRIIYFWMSLLAVVRARAIRNPLSQITQLAIRCIMCGTTTFFVLLSLVPLIIRQTTEGAFCGGRLEDTFKNKIIRKLWVGLGTLLPCALSVIVMLCANSVSLYYLLRVRSAAARANKRGLRTKRTAAKTTLLLTTIFFCLHITGVVKSWAKVLDIDIGVGGFYANGLMILSATVDPLVYFLKTPTVWTYWKRVCVTRQFTRLRRYSYARFHPFMGNSHSFNDHDTRTSILMSTFRTTVPMTSVNESSNCSPCSSTERKSSVGDET